MTKIFKVPFADTGDKISPPDAVQADGSVSYTLGYGFDYQRDTSIDSGGAPVDPLAKVFPREQHNGILNDITTAIGEIQINGFPAWQSSGGPYPINSIVRHSGSNWKSTVSNNDSTPGATGATWIDANFQPNASETVSGISRIATQEMVNLGVDDSSIVTPKKIKLAPYITDKIIGEACDVAGFTEGSVSGEVYFKHKPTQQFVFLARKNSPSLTGTPTSPTAEVGVSNNQIATTAFVMSIVNSYFPKRSFGARDFIRVPDVPGGLIIQWVLDAPEATSAGDMISFPVPFTTARLGVVATLNALSTGGLAQTANIVVSSGNLNNFQYTSGGTYGGGAVAYVLAWGY